jgi:hypothetical protein
VPQVQAGDSVLIEGWNFHELEATVRLSLSELGDPIATLEAHVCGDLETPLTDDDGNVIADSERVHDRLSFRVPEGFVPGLYWIQVVIPNNTGEFPDFEEFVTAAGAPLEVVAPDSSTYEIHFERLDCIDETGGSFSFGSDEIRIRFEPIKVTTSFAIETQLDGITTREYGGLDSGGSAENPAPGLRIIRESNVAAIAIGIGGYEVDNDDAFEQQIDDFSEAYKLVLTSSWQAIVLSVSAAAGVVAVAAGLSKWAAAIAAGVEFSFNVVLALVLPADPVIQDSIALTGSDLSRLTTVNFPTPPERSYTAASAIDVTVGPCVPGDDAPECKDQPAKLTGQYREARRYRSDDEDSTYQMTLRYNLVV